MSFPKYCNISSTEAWSAPNKMSAEDFSLGPPPQGNRRSCLNITEVCSLKIHDLVLSEFSFTHPLVFPNHSFSEWCQPNLRKEKHLLEQTVELWASELGHISEACCRRPFPSICGDGKGGCIGLCRTGDPKYDLRPRTHFLSPSITWLLSAYFLMILWRESGQHQRINEICVHARFNLSVSAFSRVFQRDILVLQPKPNMEIQRRKREPTQTGVCLIPLLSHLICRHNS